MDDEKRISNEKELVECIEAILEGSATDEDKLKAISFEIKDFKEK